MNRTKFIELLKRLQAKELEINLTKGRDYADGDDNIGANFFETADDLDMSPLKVCLVHMGKHLSAIKNLAKGRLLLSDESVESRIADIRLYCALFLALVEDGLAETPE